jgi:hypothetical protein
MAIIPQPQLFSWQQVETASDMDRLRLALKAMPDEPLMQALEEARMGRRDDYPIRALWNRVIAGIVFEHISVEQLRRELSRNAELRQRCGFDVFLGDAAVPPSWVYSRFLKKLFKHQELIDAMFDDRAARSAPIAIVGHYQVYERGQRVRLQKEQPGALGYAWHQADY